MEKEYKGCGNCKKRVSCKIHNVNICFAYEKEEE